METMGAGLALSARQTFRDTMLVLCAEPCDPNLHDQHPILTSSRPCQAVEVGQLDQSSTRAGSPRQPTTDVLLSRAQAHSTRMYGR